MYHNQFNPGIIVLLVVAALTPLMTVHMSPTENIAIDPIHIIPVVIISVIMLVSLLVMAYTTFKLGEGW